MVHEGVIRRSEDELSEVMRRGISPAVCIAISTEEEEEEEESVDYRWLGSLSVVVEGNCSS